MKVNDLMDKQQMNAAYEAGKRLAKMVSNINLTAKPTVKKNSFSAFVQASLPQPLQEITSTEDLRQLEVGLHHLFGWEVQCSSHFAQRATEREANIDISTIISVFQKLKAKYPVQIDRATKMGKTLGDIDVVVQDYSSNLNIVFVLGHKVILKTIMMINPDEFHVHKGTNKQLQFKV